MTSLAPTPVVLGVLAVVLAGPVPWALGRVRRLRRTPASALLLWQAVALAGVLAALGAGLSLVTDRTWRSSPDLAAYAVAGLALLVTAVVAGRLLLSGHVVGTELRALRRRHLDQLDLVGRRLSDGELRILDHPLALAYCVPGMSRSRIVLSSGTVARLEEGQLAAVLSHERAHLRARHDLVLEAFTVLHRAFPRVVSSARALDEVTLLVEVLADRAAARGGRTRELAQALLALAEGAPPSGARPAGSLGASDLGLLARVELLGDRRSHRLQATFVAAAALTVVGVPTLFVVWPWLRSLA